MSRKISFENTDIAFSYKSNFELKKALLLFRAINNNVLVKIGPSLTQFALKIGLPILPIIKKTLFAQFCGGETIDECMETIKTLGNFGIGSILDYSVEGEEKEEVFDNTLNEIIKTLKRGSEDKNIPFAVFKVSGLGRSNALSTAIDHSASPQMKAEITRIRERVNEICKTAYHLNLSVMIDAEESWLQSFIDDVAGAMMEKYNTEKSIVYNTYQMYRQDRLGVLEQDIQRAREKGYFLGAKIVRGAYMEKERARALKLGYASPIQSDKVGTDLDFNKALDLCLRNLDRASFVSGTHNEESCYYLADRLADYGFPNNHPHVYFSQLLGMSDHISFNLAKAGYNVVKYVPYGPIPSVLPYLFRRAEENTAISGQMGRELGLILKELERRKKS